MGNNRLRFGTGNRGLRLDEAKKGLSLKNLDPILNGLMDFFETKEQTT
jgi:hypothetical protein